MIIDLDTERKKSARLVYRKAKAWHKVVLKHYHVLDPEHVHLFRDACDKLDRARSEWLRVL